MMQRTHMTHMTLMIHLTTSVRLHQKYIGWIRKILLRFFRSTIPFELGVFFWIYMIILWVIWVIWVLWVIWVIWFPKGSKDY